MDVDEVTLILGDPVLAESWLRTAPFTDIQRATSNLIAIGRSGMTLDQVASILNQFANSIPEISDPDMALNNLERFVLAARSSLTLGSLFQRDPTALPILLRIFSASQHLSDLLIRETENYDALRLTEGQLYSRDILVEELSDSISKATVTGQAMQILRRFKHRETLRIAFGDLVVCQRLEQVVEQISFLAEAIIEAARCFVYEDLAKQWGPPKSVAGSPCRFAILALGKLGGKELNYSSDIDLIAVYESDGKTEKSSKPNRVFFERTTRDLIKLLNETTALGAAYRVDMRLRPEGSRGPICCNQKSFLSYYDLQGRTWERQALIKARPVAGDLQFGAELLNKLQPWVYQRILNRFDIASIKSLKRRIEHRTIVAGEETTNVKTGHGGIRDIEFTIQFLQLLNGGAVPAVRTGNTLEAIRLLAAADCLNRQEAELLAQNYRWLRKLEHLLQIMFDLQTHTLPEQTVELSKIAFRMGYRESFDQSALEQFNAELTDVRGVNNRILHHLLHNAFSDSEEFDQTSTLNAVDLVLQHELPENEVDRILKESCFDDVKNAKRSIASLGKESNNFLSSHRCRHFLAAVIILLLEKISRTPTPDATLVSLTNVADAIGGKGALWELFSANPPSLELFVQLCASSDYLCSIVRRNPGMIDELIDSLVMNQLPSRESLRADLTELAAGAIDTELILHSFKNIQHLRVGIRDIVGRDPIRETHRAISDVADVCVEQVARIEFEKCAVKHLAAGISYNQIHDRNGLVILALGKWGGQEPNYHSDLDVVFLYDSAASKNDWLNTSPQHFYSQLASQITIAITAMGPIGKLFELDSRLRPTGKSGSLAVSFHELERYFESGDGQLWERQALCKSRTVFGSSELQDTAAQLVRCIVSSVSWNPVKAEQIRSMRLRMQQDCSPRNLKRGAGGTVDIEFIVQLLQLKHAASHPAVLVPGTVNAIEELMRAKTIASDVAAFLTESYQYLRSVESRLRLMNTTARHDLPSEVELQKLAYLLKLDANELEQQVAKFRLRNRELFEQIFDRESCEI